MGEVKVRNGGGISDQEVQVSNWECSINAKVPILLVLTIIWRIPGIENFSNFDDCPALDLLTSKEHTDRLWYYFVLSQIYLYTQKYTSTDILNHICTY